MQGTWIGSLVWADSLEKEMTTHSSILAWEIPWTEESGRLQSMWSQRVRYDLATEQQTNQTVNTHRMLKRTSVAVGNACQLDPETVETNNRGLPLFIVETVGLIGASQVPLVVKNPPCQCRKHKRKARSLGKEDPLEKGMATHSSILAWRIPWNLAGYSPLGHTVGHDWSNLICIPRID